MPTGQSNQYVAWREEADTVKEWTKEDIQKFLLVDLTVTPAGQVSAAGPGAIKVIEDAPEPSGVTVNEILDAINSSGLVAPSEELNSTPDSIPRLYEGRLSAGCRNKLGRDLESLERVKVRDLFRQVIRERTTCL